MDIIALAAKALEPIRKRGISVKQGWYDANLKKTHITLWNISDTDDGHCDDQPELSDGIVQINIWAVYDAVDLKREVKNLMFNSGFCYQDGQDVDEDPGIYNKAMRFYKLEESEE